MTRSETFREGAPPDIGGHTPDARIEILYVEGCPYYPPVVDLVREILRGIDSDATIREVRISGPDDALARQFLGSPSVRVDGADVELAARVRLDYGFACRTYANGTGIPSRHLIEDAVITTLAAK